jgi:predicted molibdopterin-dependent oxidoreductase YjgC
MGAYSTAFPGGVAIDTANAERFSDLWGFRVPADAGLQTVDVLESAAHGGIDALYAIGGNFLETLPEPARVERALSRIPLRIVSDIVATTQLLAEPGEVVYCLPARTRYEQEGGGTETTTERRVVFSPHVQGHDVGEARSDWQSLLDLARSVKPENYAKVHFSSAAEIRADIERAVPIYAGIATLSKQGDQFQWGGPRLCTQRRFATRNGKAHFQPVEPPPLEAPRTNTFVLATRRGKQFNSMVQRDRDPLTGAERDHVLIAFADARHLGLSRGDALVLENETGRFARNVARSLARSERADSARSSRSRRRRAGLQRDGAPVTRLNLLQECANFSRLPHLTKDCT